MKTFLFNLSIVVIRVRFKLLIETNIRKELSFAIAHDIQSHVTYCTYDVYIICLYIFTHSYSYNGHIHNRGTFFWT